MYHSAVRKWLGAPGTRFPYARTPGMTDSNDDRSCLFPLMARDITLLLNTAKTGYTTCVIFSCRSNLKLSSRVHL